MIAALIAGNWYIYGDLYENKSRFTDILNSNVYLQEKPKPQAYGYNLSAYNDGFGSNISDFIYEQGRVMGFIFGMVYDILCPHIKELLLTRHYTMLSRLRFLMSEVEF